MEKSLQIPVTVRPDYAQLAKEYQKEAVEHYHEGRWHESRTASYLAANYLRLAEYYDGE